MKSETVTLVTYRNAGERLDKELNTIFEKCTMTGAARGILNEALFPMIALVKDLKEKDEYACTRAIGDLLAQMTILNSTFK